MKIRDTGSMDERHSLLGKPWSRRRSPRSGYANAVQARATEYLHSLLRERLLRGFDFVHSRSVLSLRRDCCLHEGQDACKVEAWWQGRCMDHQPILPFISRVHLLRVLLFLHNNLYTPKLFAIMTSFHSAVLFANHSLASTCGAEAVRSETAYNGCVPGVDARACSMIFRPLSNSSSVVVRGGANRKTPPKDGIVLS